MLTFGQICTAAQKQQHISSNYKQFVFRESDKHLLNPSRIDFTQNELLCNCIVREGDCGAMLRYE